MMVAGCIQDKKKIACLARNSFFDDGTVDVYSCVRAVAIARWGQTAIMVLLLRINGLLSIIILITIIK